MSYSLVNIGYGNLVSAGRLISIVCSESAPAKRMIQEARKSGMLIDATCGRRTRAVLVMDSNHVILSAIQAKAIGNRMETKLDEEDPY